MKKELQLLSLRIWNLFSLNSPFVQITSKKGTNHQSSTPSSTETTSQQLWRTSRVTGKTSIATNWPSNTRDSSSFLRSSSLTRPFSERIWTSKSESARKTAWRKLSSRKTSPSAFYPRHSDKLTRRQPRLPRSVRCAKTNSKIRSTRWRRQGVTVKSWRFRTAESAVSWYKNRTGSTSKRRRVRIKSSFGND
jgi:hypothetical protein